MASRCRFARSESTRLSRSRKNRAAHLSIRKVRAKTGTRMVNRSALVNPLATLSGSKSTGSERFLWRIILQSPAFIAVAGPPPKGGPGDRGPPATLARHSRKKPARDGPTRPRSPRAPIQLVTLACLPLWTRGWLPIRVFAIVFGSCVSCIFYSLSRHRWHRYAYSGLERGVEFRRLRGFFFIGHGRFYGGDQVEGGPA